MRLEKLTLKNFRGFESLEIDFDPSFTVLLGGNMAGKTAVLEAVAVALCGFFHGTNQGSIRDVEAHDVRRVLHQVGGVPDLQPQLPASVVAQAAVGGARLVWKRERRAIDSDYEFEDIPLAVSNELRTRVQAGEAVDLPVIAQYGTRRGWHGDAVPDQQRVGNRYDGYAGCFDITSTHGALAGWMRKQTLVELQRGNAYRQPQLTAVVAAVRSCINAVSRFWYDVQYEELRIERDGGDIQSFAMLSEGYRNMVAMVADISWRASVLNPHHGDAAAARAEGVVLIDEIDLHLHPAWQRRVVDDLRRTFPKLQFIVTTHSPQVVASVSREQVRLLDRNKLVASELYVEGRDTNGLLEDVFGVPARPDKVQGEIDALYRSIEDEDFAVARQQLADLQERLGTDDAAMIRARWILDTEAADGASAAPPAP